MERKRLDEVRVFGREFQDTFDGKIGLDLKGFIERESYVSLMDSIARSDKGRMVSVFGLLPKEIDENCVLFQLLWEFSILTKYSSSLTMPILRSTSCL